MLELSHINKIYNPGETTQAAVFDDFSLRIAKGEFVSIVGSNGSGKTTMLNLICGTIPLDSGRILLDGKDVCRLPEYMRYRMIGRVYQNPAMGSCPDLTVAENMALADQNGGHFGLQRGVDRKCMQRYREQLATLGLGLEEKLHTRVGALSGGQRQAMSLLMATMTPLGFLILDEHTAALDPKTADLVMELTDRVVRQKKLTAVMVTHNLRYAVEYGNRILMLHKGKAVLDRMGEDKANTGVQDLLALFNEISVECGN